MSEFACSVCNYKSPVKKCVEKHIKKKIKCGEGIPTVLVIPVDIICSVCNKRFSTKETLLYHTNNTCKNKNSELLNKIKELEYKLALSEASKSPQTIINNTINIVVNGYNETNVEKLKDRHFLNAINKMILSVPNFIKDVHFNPDLPENQNIYISNLRNGYVMVFNAGTKNWEARPKAEMIDRLINDREYDIQEWLGEGDKYPKAMQKFNEYLEKKEEDGVQKIIKEEVEYYTIIEI